MRAVDHPLRGEPPDPAVRARRRADGWSSAVCMPFCGCPTGIFYAGGIKANALFLDREPPPGNPWTQQLWIYDLRANPTPTPGYRGTCGGWPRWTCQQSIGTPDRHHLRWGELHRAFMWG